MAYFSDFVAYWADNQHRVPRRLATDCRIAAVARTRERVQAGRGDKPLLFDDLIARMDAALQPR